MKHRLFSPNIRFRKRLLATLLTAGLATACTLGPNYRKPSVQIPTAYPNRQVQAKAMSYADLPWWQVFQDPVLQSLIRTALEQNFDLQVATEHINAARAQLGLARASQFPQVEANAGFSGEKSDEIPSKSTFLSVTSDVAFQLDFFGQMRRATEASRAQLLANEEARRTVVVTLVSDVATDYFQLLSLDEQYRIARATVRTQLDSVNLTFLLLDSGVANKLDVLQAEEVFDSAYVLIPDLERQIGQEEDAISILLGHYPYPVPRGRPLVEQPFPPDVPPGMPSALLERRPDIRQAEQMLIAANAEIGVAKAQYFPQISLTGSGGGAFGRSSLFSSLMSSQTSIWNYGLSATQPIFDAGRRRSNVLLAKSQYQQALIAYQQSIQHAFGDVSDALIGYQKLRQVRLRWEDSVAHLEEAVRLALIQYRGGTANYLQVLDCQRSLFSAQLSLARARADEYLSVVQLYKALGGGWQQ
jgi:multidrug efflux system outer membrane protein